MIYLGVDPGSKGHAVAIADDGAYIDVIQLSETEHTIWEEVQELVNLSHPDGLFATIEQVHSMPGQGVASTFKFGMGFGFVRGLLVASGIPHEYVRPQVWMKAMGIPPKTDKGANLGAAQRLYPHLKMSKSGLTTSYYDALLIAEYGRRKHKGLL